MKRTKPRHYVSYVREDLIASWKVHAVTGEETSANRHRPLDVGLIAEAEKRRASLAGDSSRVWPWAFQLGRTPAARSLKKRDVLWIVSRLSGLGRQWPPALVAKMELAEDAQLGPGNHESRGDFPFPFHFGVSVFSLPDGGEFFPANDATRALLKTRYRTPLDEFIKIDELPLTLNEHVSAWRAVSRTGFQSLRRIVDPTPLEVFAERLRTHSVFLSYRWADHSVNPDQLFPLRELTEELMIRHQTGVWLDRLTLPESKHAKLVREAVIERLLYTPLRETPLLIARVTETYGGPSEHNACRPGFSLFEWCTAKCTVAWGHVEPEREAWLRSMAVPIHWFSQKQSIPKVAEKVDRLLGKSLC